MRNRTLNAYNQWASRYDLDPNPLITLEHQAVLKAVSAKKGEAILDAACGTGKYSEEFARAGAKVTGCDFSKAMLAIAARKSNEIAYVVANLTERLPFRSAQFHKVNCAQALKHIKNLRFTLKEFARVLKPNGILTFSVTHPDMYWDDFEMSKVPDFILCEHADIHHHKFSDYLEAIEKAGLHLQAIQQVAIAGRIRHLLTPRSFRKTKGRYMVAVFSARKA